MIDVITDRTLKKFLSRHRDRKDEQTENLGHPVLAVHSHVCLNA